LSFYVLNRYEVTLNRGAEGSEIELFLWGFDNF